MALIRTIPEDQAEGLLQEWYQADAKTNGYIPNYTKAFSLNPEAYDAWKKLIGTVRSKMRLRRFELVTFAAAMTLQCNYCMLAHGAVLRKNFFSADELAAIVKDFRHAGLTDEEVALMSFAQKVISEPQQTSQEDTDELRRLGLNDEDILNVVLVCTARSFFSKTLDALDVLPDEAYLEFEPELLKLLTPGRPYSKEMVQKV
jgi:uncharacterized peroxidase-related enzyme